MALKVIHQLQAFSSAICRQHFTRLHVYSSTPRRQNYCGSVLRQLPSQSSAVHVNQFVVKPVTVVRDLAVWFDDELSMRSHVSRVTQTCFYHLRHIVPSVDSSAAMSQRD